MSLKSAPFSRNWLAEQLERQTDLAADAGVPRYVHPPGRVPVPAAVLVPVVNQPGGPTLMFTQRSLFDSTYCALRQLA